MNTGKRDPDSIEDFPLRIDKPGHGPPPFLVIGIVLVIALYSAKNAGRDRVMVG
jgi:hypothetical protein